MFMSQFFNHQSFPAICAIMLVGVICAGLTAIMNLMRNPMPYGATTRPYSKYAAERALAEELRFWLEDGEEVRYRSWFRVRTATFRGIRGMAERAKARPKVRLVDDLGRDMYVPVRNIILD